eukprot:4013771-Prymnesium_polylepis.3
MTPSQIRTLHALILITELVQCAGPSPLRRDLANMSSALDACVSNNSSGEASDRPRRHVPQRNPGRMHLRRKRAHAPKSIPASCEERAYKH